MTERVPTLNKVFDELSLDMPICRSYEPHDYEGATREIAWLLRNPDEAEKLVKNGRKWVEENHTYEHRIREALIPILEDKQWQNVPT